MDLQGVPGPEVRDVRPDLGLLDFGDRGMHDGVSSVVVVVQARGSKRTPGKTATFSVPYLRH
jgi:hypothetical protein